MQHPTDENALGFDENEVPCRSADCEPNSAAGLWDPHDIFFSRDGERMYVAAIESTFIVSITGILDTPPDPPGESPAVDADRTDAPVLTISIIPNEMCPEDRLPDNTRPGACADEQFYEGAPPEGLDHVHNIEVNHQADITSDEAILVITDERGGGLTNDECVTDPSDNGIIGSAHFWAVKPIPGIDETSNASEANPIFIGAYVNPNPGLNPETQALVDALEVYGRSERGCTAHVFRLGGNGTAAPGPMLGPGDAEDFDGVSDLPNRQMVEAWYGAGVWWIDFSGLASNDDGIAEDTRTTWGNTLGWNVMPAADTWSAKEYNGYIYAGDITRGFDVYAFEECEGAACGPAAESPAPTGDATASPGATDDAGGGPGATRRPGAGLPNTATDVPFAALAAVLVLASAGILAAARLAEARRRIG